MINIDIISGSGMYANIIGYFLRDFMIIFPANQISAVGKGSRWCLVELSHAVVNYC